MMDMNGTSHSMDMGMKMVFHFGTSERLLFEGWEIRTATEMIGAVVASYLFAIVYEGLKTMREWLLYYDIKQFKEESRTNGNGKRPVKKTRGRDEDRLQLVEDKFKKPNRARAISISFGMHLLQSILHIIQVGSGYLLMFIAMTFNGWLFLAVCFGAGTGYFLFAKTRHLFGLVERDENEHCTS